MLEVTSYLLMIGFFTPNQINGVVSNLVFVALYVGSMDGSGWFHAQFCQKGSVSLDGTS